MELCLLKKEMEYFFIKYFFAEKDLEILKKQKGQTFLLALYTY